MWADRYIGKLVIVSHWSDFKLEDATKLGVLSEVRGEYFYIAGDARGYRHCRPVSRNKLVTQEEPCDKFSGVTQI